MERCSTTPASNSGSLTHPKRSTPWSPSCAPTKRVGRRRTIWPPCSSAFIPIQRDQPMTMLQNILKVRTSLIGRSMLVSLAGVALLGISVGIFVSVLLHRDATQAALEKVASDERVAWAVL